jgi:hypothetical protein
VIPGKGPGYEFGAVTTDSNGTFVFSTRDGRYTDDQNYWNTDVGIWITEPSTGWIQEVSVNGGIFVGCNPPPFSENLSYSISFAVPLWSPGQNFSCPTLPPPSSGGGGGGGGLGGCSALGAAGCGCKPGGICNSGLVCEYGTTCIACGGGHGRTLLLW